MTPDESPPAGKQAARELGAGVTGSPGDPHAQARAARGQPLPLHSMSVFRELFETIFRHREIAAVVEVGVESGQVSALCVDLGATGKLEYEVTARRDDADRLAEEINAPQREIARLRSELDRVEDRDRRHAPAAGACMRPPRSPSGTEAGGGRVRAGQGAVRRYPQSTRPSAMTPRKPAAPKTCLKRGIWK